MLDQYIAQLTQNDEKQKTASAHYETLPIVELAKQAGIELPENICTSCMGEMKKLGSIFQCSCGMMKTAVAACATCGKKDCGCGCKGDASKCKCSMKKEAMAKCSKCGKEKKETDNGVECGCGVKLAEDPSWWEKQKGVNRAMRSPDASGMGKIIADPELIGKRFKGALTGAAKGLGIGAAGGAGVGLLTSLLSKGRIKPGMGTAVGAGVGGLGGAAVGDVAGMYGVDKKWLGERGITPTWGGMSSEFNPEARAKYLKKPEAQAGLPTAGEEAEGEIAKASSDLTKLQPHPSMSKDKDAPYGYLAQVKPGWHEGKSSDTGKPSMDKEALDLSRVKDPALRLAAQGQNAAESLRGTSSWLAPLLGGAAGAGVGAGAYAGLKKKEDSKDKEAGIASSLMSAATKVAPKMTAAAKSGFGAAKQTAKSKGLLTGGKELSTAAARGHSGQAAKQLGHAKKMFGESVPGQALSKARAVPGQVAETFKGSRAGGQGVGGALLDTAKKHPAVAAGVGGLAAGAVGASMMGGKETRASVSDAVIKVGESAGKMLAKTAAFDNTPIPIDELRESLDEAKGREDIQGRGRRAAITGGVLGGLAGGGAGAAAGKKMFGTPGMIAGGLLGAGSAGGAGAYFGKGYGQEEARADKALSLLRAMRAHQSGAGVGYRAGVQRGYGLSQQGAGE